MFRAFKQILDGLLVQVYSQFRAMPTGERRASRHSLQRLRHYFHRLSPTQQRVAEYFMQHPVEALGSSVQEIAARCGTSTSTVVRLAKDIGFEGLKEMKIALAQEVGTLVTRIEMDELREPSGHAHYLLENTVKGLQETFAGLDHEVVKRAAEVLGGANRVDVYAAGSSFLVASDLVEKLKRIGIYASTYANDYMQAISSGGLAPGDVAFAVSYSGETSSVIESMTIAKDRGATTLALTNFPDSTIVEHADIVLPTSVSSHLVPDGSLGGRIAQLWVVDLLFIELFASDPERFRRAYRTYNEILLRKIRKYRDRLGLGGTTAEDAHVDEPEISDIARLVKGEE